MGTSLTGNTIASSYLGLLKSTDSLAIGGTKKIITDGAGNDLPFGISTSSLTFNAGAVDVPTLSIGTINEGFYQPTDETLGGTINGSEVARFNSTGLGIGVSPASGFKLTTSDQSWIKGGLLVGGTNGVRTSGSTLVIDGGGDSSVNLRFILNSTGYATSDGGQIIFSDTGMLSLRSMESSGSNYGINLQQKGGSTILFAEATNKNVGINTLTPSSKLTISGGDILLDNSNKLLWGNTSDVYIAGTTSADNIQLGVGGSTQFTFAQTTGVRLHQYGSGSITGTVTQRLGVTSTGQVVEIPIGAGALDGSGTAGKIAKFTDSDTLGDSLISESGSTISINGTVDANSFTDIITDQIFTAGGSLDIDTSLSSRDVTFTQSSNNLMTIKGNASGVGIGTTSPASKAHVAFTADFDGLRIQNSTRGHNYLLTTAGTSAEVFSIYDLDNTNNLAQFGNSGVSLYTGGTERFNINSSGNATFAGDVNISGGNLQIGSGHNTASAGNAIIFASYGSGTNIAGGEVQIYGGRSTGSASGGSIKFYTSPTGSSGSSSNAHIQALSIDSSQKATFAGDISLTQANTPTIELKDTTNNQFLLIRHNNSASIFDVHSSSHYEFQINSSEKMRLDNSGRLAINTTTASQPLTVAGNVDVIKDAGNTTLFHRIHNQGTATNDDAVLTWQTQASRHFSMGIHRDSGELTISSNDASVADNEMVTMALNGDMNFASNGNATRNFIFKNTDTTGTSVRTHLEATAGNRTTRLEAIHSDYNYVVGSSSRLYLQTNDASNTPLTLDGNNATFANHVVVGSGSSATANADADNLVIEGSSNTGLSILTPDTSESNVMFGTDALANQARLNYSLSTVILSLATLSGSGQIALKSGNNSEAIRIDSSQLVGIGTTSPSSYNSAANHLVIAGTGNTGITIAGGTSNDSNIFFADGTSGADAYRGIIRFQHSDDSMLFFTPDSSSSTAERARINSSGNLGLGTSTIRQRLHQHVTDSGSNYHAFTNSTTGTDTADGFVVGINADESALVWNQENTELIFATNNTERARILANGDFVIGNTVVNPASGFSDQRGFGYDNSTGNVEIGTTGDAPLTLGRNKSADGSLLILRKESSVIGTLGSNATSGEPVFDISASSSNGHMRFLTNGSEAVRIDKSQNVAVGNTTAFGTTSNRTCLSVNGTTDVSLNIGTGGAQRAFLYSNGAYARLATASSIPLQLGSNDTADVVILDNGNVGVGTTAPSSDAIVKFIEIEDSTSAGIVLDAPRQYSIFSSSSSTLSFRDEDAGETRLTLDSSGNFGVGTNVPTMKLTIAHADQDGLRFTCADGLETFIDFGDASDNDIGRISYDHADNHMAFRTNNSERARITSDGRSFFNYSNETISTYGSGAYGGTVVVKAPSGSSNGLAILNESIGGTSEVALNFTNEFVANQYNYLGRIVAIPESSWTGTASTRSSALSFQTNNAGTISEKARISSAGIFMVNQTAGNSDADGFVVFPTGSSNGTMTNCYNGDDGIALRVGRNSDGDSVQFVRGTSSVGTVSVTSSATSYNTSSDYRLKEDLKDFNALEIASKIKMYDFKWKADDTRSYGVMAHELQEVVPQAVSGDKDDQYMQQVDYSKLVPILLKSIQELEARVKELEKEI